MKALSTDFYEETQLFPTAQSLNSASRYLLNVSLLCLNGKYMQRLDEIETKGPFYAYGNIAIHRIENPQLREKFKQEGKEFVFIRILVTQWWVTYSFRKKPTIVIGKDSSWYTVMSVDPEYSEYWSSVKESCDLTNEVIICLTKPKLSRSWDVVVDHVRKVLYKGSKYKAENQLLLYGQFILNQLLDQMKSSQRFNFVRDLQSRLSKTKSELSELSVKNRISKKQGTKNLQKDTSSSNSSNLELEESDGFNPKFRDDQIEGDIWQCPYSECCHIFNLFYCDHLERKQIIDQHLQSHFGGISQLKDIAKENEKRVRKVLEELEMSLTSGVS